MSKFLIPLPVSVSEQTQCCLQGRPSLTFIHCGWMLNVASRVDQFVTYFEQPWLFYHPY